MQVNEYRPYLFEFQQYCIFRHVVVTGSWVGLFWFLLILVLLFNIWLIVKWQVHAPVTTTGRKILITQIIAEIRTPVIGVALATPLTTPLRIKSVKMCHIYEPILDSYQAKTGWQVKSVNFKLNYFSRLQKKKINKDKKKLGTSTPNCLVLLVTTYFVTRLKAKIENILYTQTSI